MNNAIFKHIVNDILDTSTPEPDYDLAAQAIAAQFDGVTASSLEYRDDIAGNNHCFQFGSTTYSAWQIENSGAWVAELKPTVTNGTVVAYAVIDIERID